MLKTDVMDQDFQASKIKILGVENNFPFQVHQSDPSQRSLVNILTSALETRQSRTFVRSWKDGCEVSTNLAY